MEFVIFGASNYGKAIYEGLQNTYNIKYFCDNSKEKQGIYFCGLKVILPSQINANQSVIIASQFKLEIAFQLIKMGIKKFYIEIGYLNGKIKLKHFDFSEFENFDVDFNKICTISTNNSGSNTLAFKKLANSDMFNIVNININANDLLSYYHIFTSGIILETITTYYNMHNFSGQVNMQLWHGFPIKNLGYMDKSVDLAVKKKWNQYFNKNMAVFSYSTIYNTLIGAAYSVPGDKFHITGMPRNDFLFKSNGRKNLKKIFEDIYNKNLILYAPTFRGSAYYDKNGSDNAYLYVMPDMDLVDFDDFLGKNDAVLIMKMHPLDIEYFTKKLSWSTLKNIRLLKDEDLLSYDYDLYELLNAFDLLITDYSSIYFDYLLLDRQMIFMPIDLVEYSETRGIMLEPYDLWTPGEKVVDYKKLKEELTKFFIGKDSYAAERSRIKRIAHKYTDGNSTDRVMKKIAELCNKT